jgi:LysM repeat protein
LFGKSSISGITSRSEIERIKVNVTYKVQEGDTIWDIAEDFNVSYESILKYNKLTENSVLQIGQKLVIPNVVKTVIKIIPVKAEAPEPTKAEQPATPAPQPADNNVIIADLPKDLYIVKEGDTLASVAEDYGVTVKALAELNNLPEDAVLQPEQELKIPEALPDTPQTDQAPTNTDAKLKGEYLGWFDTVQYIFKNDAVATVTDLGTGKSFKVKRLYGHNHADVEPLTKEDTAIMKSIYGSWSWDRRAIILAVDGRNIAASMNGMPHGGEQIKDNNFKVSSAYISKAARPTKATEWIPPTRQQ